jgi:hypothetical protein
MINYIKPNNEELFISMETLQFTKIQNYVPIYNDFFMLNKTNFNSIQLKNDWILKSVDSKINDELHTYNATIQNSKSCNIETTDIFIKEAPLLDPFKFVSGKYKNNLSCITNLPSFTYNPVENTHPEYIIPKVLNTQNSAYVDGLFNYLNGCLQKEGFVHGISFYGSYLSVKNKYSFNIADDFEYLMHSSYFKKNNGVLFTIPNTNNSNNTNTTLQIIDAENIDLQADMTLDDLIDISATTTCNSNSIKSSDESDDDDVPLDLIEQNTNNNSTQSVSEYSTTSSVIEDEKDELIYPISFVESFIPYVNNNETSTQNKSMSGKDYMEVDSDSTGSDTDDDSDDDDDDNNESDSDKSKNSKDDLDGDTNSWSTLNSQDNDTDSYLTDSDEYMEAIIPEFPVHLICIEKCKNTLDSLLLHNTLSEDELFACMMQIIMILITYQSGFQFTHNDLHTNNIVYIETSKKYIVYTYKEEKYLVPTYGKIYKIIDFGRSIYTINNILVCGDSYLKHEDAYSQYNFGPCLQPNKPIVEPNYSFDLCRLACSMIDGFIDSYDTEALEEITPFSKLLLHLCLDDNGYHILYKQNREERYPNFTLYKMIARTVHLHTPQNILQLECFKLYKHFNPLLITSNDAVVDNISIDINKLIQYIKNSEDL